MAEELFSTKDAAVFCGVTVECIKYHVYTSKKLVPDFNLSRRLGFTRQTLEQWNARRKAYWKG